MPRRKKLRHFAIILIASLSILYYYVSLGNPIDNTFLTISTFLFSIFAGFFVSQQSSRQRTIRNEVAKMNGNVSFIYRSFGHFGSTYQNEIGEIIKRNYGKIVSTKNWGVVFSPETTFLMDMHRVFEKVLSDEEVHKTKAPVLTRIAAVLADIQRQRKTVVTLREEKVPISQWVLIYILMAILIVTLSLLPSKFIVFESVLKAGFVTATIFVVVILSRFDRLLFFEDIVGENSAKDVLEIVEGVKK